MGTGSWGFGLRSLDFGLRSLTRCTVATAPRQTCEDFKEAKAQGQSPALTEVLLRITD